MYYRPLQNGCQADGVVMSALWLPGRNKRCMICTVLRIVHRAGEWCMMKDFYKQITLMNWSYREGGRCDDPCKRCLSVLGQHRSKHTINHAAGCVAMVVLKALLRLVKIYSQKWLPAVFVKLEVGRLPCSFFVGMLFVEVTCRMTIKLVRSHWQSMVTSSSPSRDCNLF